MQICPTVSAMVTSCTQSHSLSARYSLCLRTDRGIACQSSAEAAVAVHSATSCTALQGMQELHKAAPQTAGGEADPETQQAVQRVFNLVRNGTSGSAAKDCNLTLDDVVRFYNVSDTPAGCAKDNLDQFAKPELSKLIQ